MQHGYAPPSQGGYQWQQNWQQQAPQGQPWQQHGMYVAQQPPWAQHGVQQASFPQHETGSTAQHGYYAGQQPAYGGYPPPYNPSPGPAEWQAQPHPGHAQTASGYGYAPQHSVHDAMPPWLQTQPTAQAPGAYAPLTPQFPGGHDPAFGAPPYGAAPQYPQQLPGYPAHQAQQYPVTNSGAAAWAGHMQYVGPAVRDSGAYDPFASTAAVAPPPLPQSEDYDPTAAAAQDTQQRGGGAARAAAPPPLPGPPAPSASVGAGGEPGEGAGVERAADAASGESEPPPLPPDATMSAELCTAEAAAEPAPPAVDAGALFLPPGRATRPPAILVIIRGVPGSGKSHLAQRIHDAEVRNGGAAPRVLSIDAYFLAEPDDAAAAGTAAGADEEEVYRHDAAMEPRYEAALATRLAQAVADARHSIVIVDAPLLSLSRLQVFWSAGKAASYEVFVTQPPDQDPQSCYMRNAHNRAYADIAAAAAALEPPAPSMLCMDPAALLADDAVAGAAGDGGGKRGRDGVGAAPAAAGPLPATKRVRAEGAAEAMSDAELLADLNSSLNSGDAAEGAAAAAHHRSGTSKPQEDAGPRSRWENEDEEEEQEEEGGENGARGGVQARRGGKRGADGDNLSPASGGAGGGAGGTLGDRLQEFLRKPKQRVRKSVWWPDLVDDSGPADGGTFRIGRPRQLEIVHLLEGLGPDPEVDCGGGGGGDEHSFAAAVKAEHSSEHAQLQAHGWHLH